MQKRFLSCFIIAVLLAVGVIPTSAMEVSAQSAVLISADTKEIVFEKNSSLRLPMASTTKIMTALVALENASLDEVVTVSPLAVGVEGSSVYLFAGEKITMETLLFALMLESANDAAAAIALHISGSIDAFADMMNKKAAELGLTNTHFTNPHGLYDEDHYTSAHDLALIAAAALQNAKFLEIVSTYKKSAPMTEGGVSRLFINHNKMLKIYEGAIGVKTGFTKKSGRCLVSAAKREGMTFIAVTLSAPDDWRDHTALLDLAFGRYEKILLAKANEFGFILPVISGNIPFIKVENRKDVYAYINKDNKNITKTVELDRFYFAEIKKGDILGHVIFYNNGNEIAKAELVADFDVPRIIYKSRWF